MAIQNLSYDYTEIDEALGNALQPGLMYLLSSDDNPGSIAQNTASETSLKTYSLPANTYTSILVECEIEITNNVRDSNPYTHTYRIKLDTTILKTSNIVTEESTLRRLVIPFKFKMAGGSSGTIGIFGQMDAADTGLSIQALSLRIFGIK